MTDRLGQRFWTLWSAFSLSNLGDGISLVAYPLLAVSLTNDARLVALVTVARFIPFLVVGLPAGVAIDRYDRRHVAIIAQTIRVVTLMVLGVLVAADAASILFLVLTGLVVGTGEVLIDGGLPAIVRDVVRTDQLEVANSRLRASETVANGFIGPPVGALLFGIGHALPFFFAGVSFLVTILVLIALPGSFKAERKPDEGSVIKQMRVGLTYVWGHPVLRPLAFAVAAFSFAGSAHQAVFVLLATERFGFSDFQFGLLLAVSSVVSVATSFFVAALVAKTSHSWSMRLAVATFAIHAFLFGFFVAVPIVIVAAVIYGISDPTWNVISATVRQRLVDDRIFGRMMTAYLFVAWSIRPLGALVGGVIAEQWGTQWVYVMVGAVVGSLLVFAAPMFRRIDEAMAQV